eukprot:gb/GEZN01020662.1/.p1 GENE.gb/GEZN01020662.1/~~gb/GEZN01020662.1/.p1  ORF type:complete len:114 (+),score=14.37 gb/GEZN01020662.1/:238-579(+)
MHSVNIQTRFSMSRKVERFLAYRLDEDAKLWLLCMQAGPTKKEIWLDEAACEKLDNFYDLSRQVAWPSKLDKQSLLPNMLCPRGSRSQRGLSLRWRAIINGKFVDCVKSVGSG